MSARILEGMECLHHLRVRTCRMNHKILPVCRIAFERQRRGMSIAQGVSPGIDKTLAINSLSLWERARVREFMEADLDIRLHPGAKGISFTSFRYALPG